MKNVCIIGNEDGSVREAILKVLATNAPTTFAQTAFKDCETGEITSIMPLFEITKQTFDEDFKSGKEKRRERRARERKNKKL